MQRRCAKTHTQHTAHCIDGINTYRPNSLYKLDCKKRLLTQKYFYFGVAHVHQPTSASLWFGKTAKRVAMVNVTETQGKRGERHAFFSVNVLKHP